MPEDDKHAPICLAVYSSGLSFVIQEAVEMNGKQGRKAKFRNMLVKIPELLNIFSFYVILRNYAINCWPIPIFVNI
jgi:hypothetical protein